MNLVLPLNSRYYLSLSIAMMTCLILLINVSFKIIALGGLIFSATSVLCPVVAGFYLWIGRVCTPSQQQQVLNQALLALYVFSIGVYLLVNLPTMENLRGDVAYQIIFTDIPRKFFSSTLAFGLSFYLPYLYKRPNNADYQFKPLHQLVRALLGGFFFFLFDFFLLFFDVENKVFFHIFYDSMYIAISLLFVIGVAYLLAIYIDMHEIFVRRETSPPSFFQKPIYHYLTGFSVTILLICLTCEYRLVVIDQWVLAASGTLFPLTIVASNLVGELYGYRANLYWGLFLVIAELVFDFLLMLTVMLPSPGFFDLNPFYAVILPRRIPAALFALLIAFFSNAFLLEKLKKTIYASYPALRIFVANIVAHTLLCLVNYSILFTGVLSYDQIFNLAVNSWVYKFLFTLISLPVVLQTCKILRTKT